MSRIRDIRRANLCLLVKMSGGQSALAKKIQRDRNQVWQWTLPRDDPASRGIGEKMARHLERSLGKPAGWMDDPVHLRDFIPRDIAGQLRDEPKEDLESKYHEGARPVDTGLLAEDQRQVLRLFNQLTIDQQAAWLAIGRALHSSRRDR